ncbi:hypothetical protein O3G_MSEX009896 [Manduca sexta]|uniref:Uncharacterized protein n=1 Tax=Manduca sexta TaxID=7130 RepID=A0A921ZFA6_MANSE|nr:hypothetical protein O3G_MSEX009896 [Manduca sexta]
MANTVHLKRVYGNSFEIVVPGMANKDAAKTTKTRNRQKKYKFRKGKSKKSNSPTYTDSPSRTPSPDPVSAPSPPSPKPIPSPTTSNDIDMYPKLKIKRATQRTKTPETTYISEYYPQKLKRHTPKKKTILKNSHNLKDISERRKRKPIVPQKGDVTEPKDPQRIEYSELSMTEIVRLMEDTQKLDDDDLMEILTCPSPVWWEDAPYDEHCEDPIEKELVKEAIEGISESPPPIEEDVQIRAQLLNRQNKNKQVIKKKNKLEHILGNLKNRIFTANKDDEISKDIVVEPFSINNEVIKNEIQHDCVKNEVPKNDEIKYNENNEHNDNEIIHVADDEIHNSYNENINMSANTSAFKVLDSSEGEILSDISVNEDELLKDLETIEIPIKESSPVKRQEMEIKDIVPETLPPLLKFPYQSNNVEFNESAKFSYTESSKEKSSDDAISDEFDSISDTNVRFLDDDDVEMLTRSEEMLSDIVIDETPIIDNTTRVPETKPEKEKRKCKVIKPRKVMKTKYKRDEKVVAFFKHNKFVKKIKADVDEEKRCTGFMSMPRSIANQRKLICSCGRITCVFCFSKRNFVNNR